MITKRTVTSLAAILLVAMGSSAQAKVHTQGAYLEGNLGTLYASVDLFGYRYTQFGSVGLNTNLGYQFSENIAAEVGYTNYGMENLNNIDAAVKVIYPFRVAENDFTVFAKAGPAFLFSGSDSTVLPLVGVGASYSVTENLDTNVQVQSVSRGFFSLGLMSVGLTYHFS